MFFEGCCMAYE
jgi:hypothetical protein